MRLLFCLCLCFFSTKFHAQCTLNNSSINNLKKLASSGNHVVDNLINIEKIKLERFFNVSVDLKITSGSNGIAKKNLFELQW